MHVVTCDNIMCRQQQSWAEGDASHSASLVMAALCNRAGHYIFALWFLSSSSSFMVTLCNRADHIYIFIPSFVLLSFFLSSLISAIADWMSTILAQMVWP